MKIIGSVLVKNEDRFVEQVIRNISGFCDRIIVSDNGSNDATQDILRRLAVEYDHIELGTISDVRASQELLTPFIGGEYWVFGVDGDEIYDPAGLERMRKRLSGGEFDKWWAVFGNVLNCTMVDEEMFRASGYLAPPSRSMTKLYNFSLLEGWDGPYGHRLNGGTTRFKSGYDAQLRCELYKTVTWEEADFRCLHTCFTRRSSLDPEQPGLARQNMTDQVNQGPLGKLRGFLARSFGLQRQSAWKLEKYARGNEVEKDVEVFFKPSKRKVGQ